MEPHGQKGDFAKSVARGFSLQMRPTSAVGTVWDPSLGPLWKLQAAILAREPKDVVEVCMDCDGGPWFRVRHRRNGASDSYSLRSLNR